MMHGFPGHRFEEGRLPVPMPRRTYKLRADRGSGTSQRKTAVVLRVL